MKDLWNYLKETEKPIVLYGTGNGADKIIDRMILDGTWSKVKGIFASSGFVRDRYFRGIKVETYETLKSRLGNMIVLLCFGSSLPGVIDNVERIASENELYAPQVPVYGTGIFDSGYYNEHKEELERSRSLMADELSAVSFDNTISYFLSGDMSYLRKCEVDKADEYRLTSLMENAVYLDLGAFTGDTALEYSKVFPSISRIIAVEPDARNYRRLCDNTKEIEGITCINALISDTCGITHINQGKGRGVHEQDKGLDIECTTVDAILAGSGTDLIKFDVEGNEIKALTGAVHTVREYKPVLHIACYHRSSDLFEIPLFVNSIRDDYKIYMRHRKHLLNWDTQFICI
ncbi:MAG: FkbM family methyltransferase [Saccharofermentans sp.]|nr:FkbM family methyltransferase [Saccharofermentans sp.]